MSREKERRNRIFLSEDAAQEIFRIEDDDPEAIGILTKAFEKLADAEDPRLLGQKIQDEFTAEEEEKFEHIIGESIVDVGCVWPHTESECFEFDLQNEWTLELYNPQFNLGQPGENLISIKDGIDLQRSFSGYTVDEVKYDGLLRVRFKKDTEVVFSAPAWIVGPIPNEN